MHIIFGTTWPDVEWHIDIFTYIFVYIYRIYIYIYINPSISWEPSYGQLLMNFHLKI
jgi:hypothetical protein